MGRDNQQFVVNLKSGKQIWEKPDQILVSNKNKNKMTSIRAIDLFCGAGGSSYGARNAGAEIVAGFDY